MVDKTALTWIIQTLVACAHLNAQTTLATSDKSNGCPSFETTFVGPNSDYPQISADGRLIVFSTCSQLLPSDTDNLGDVYIRDRVTEELFLVSDHGFNGETSRPTMSADGRIIAYANRFPSPVPAISNVVIINRLTDFRAIINNASEPAVSADGNFVAFSSGSSAFVPDDTNGVSDIFVLNLSTGQYERVSVASGGVEANGNSSTSSISGNGRFVLFQSLADNLAVDDTNFGMDVFRHDRMTRETIRVSVASDGTQHDGNNDPIGEYAQLFTQSCISGDGRYATFDAFTDNFFPEYGQTNHAYVHDAVTRETFLVSRSDRGAVLGGHGSIDPTISADGMRVAFRTNADWLVPGSSGQGAIYVTEWKTQRITRVSVTATGIAQNGSSYTPIIARNGEYVTYSSDSTNLAPPPADQKSDSLGFECFSWDADIFVSRVAFETIPGDASGGFVVDFSDVNAVLTDFGKVGIESFADLNRDGVVDFADLNEVLTAFGFSCHN